MSIETALQEGRTNLSEYEAKAVLASYNIPVTRETLVSDAADLAAATADIGFPLVMKGCAPDILHKTERNLVQTDIRSEEEARAAFDAITANMNGSGGQVLVQEMVPGRRELVAGMIRDPQFGPCVMFGIGGIFTEILEDVCFRVAPPTRDDAEALMDGIRGKKILEAVRGMSAVDRDVLADILVAVGQIGLDHEAVKEIDINPLKISQGRPIAVDALIVLAQQ